LRLDCIGVLLSVKDSWDSDLERLLTVILNTGHQASLISAALSMEACSHGLYQWAHLGNRRVVLLVMSQPQSLRCGPWPSLGQAGWILDKTLLVLKQIFPSIILAESGD